METSGDAAPSPTSNTSTHTRLLRLGLGLDQNPPLLSAFLRSSFDSGHPSHALLLFRSTHNPDVPLSDSAVHGLVVADRMADALALFAHMRRRCLPPNYFTFPFVLKACARLSDLRSGETFHAHVLKAGFQLDVFVKTSLLCLYAKCGRLRDAHNLFDEMPVTNVVSWTVIINGYISEGRLKEALGLFRKMLEMDLMPDRFTLVGS